MSQHPSSTVRSGHHPAAQRRGLLLVAMLLALTLLGLAVIGLVVAGGQLSDADRRRLNAARAEYNNDAALALSLREISQASDLDTDGTIGGISDDNNPATGPSLNGGLLSADGSVPGVGHRVTASSTVSGSVRTARLIAQRSGNRRPGLLATYYFNINRYPISTTNFAATPSYVGWVPNIAWSNSSSAGNRMFPGHPTQITGVFTGFITVPTSGVWNFHADADDDVQLLINGQQLFIRGNGGGCARFNGSINLTAGTHTYELRWNDGAGSQCILAYWTPPGGTISIIPPRAFSHTVPVNRIVPALVSHATMNLAGTTEPTNISALAVNAAFGPRTATTTLDDMAHAATNSSAASALTLRYGVVDGFLEAPPGSTASSVVTITGGGSAVGTRNATFRYAIPRLIAPTAMPAATSAISISSGTTTISSDLVVPSITVNGGTLRFSESVRVHVTSDFTVQGAGQVIFDPGVVVTFYVAGAATIREDGQFNPSLDPHRVMFCMIGTSQALSIRSTLGACGHFFNPMGSITIDEDTPWPVLSGTFQANTITVNDKASFHLDGGPRGTETPVMRIGSYSDR